MQDCLKLVDKSQNDIQRKKASETVAIEKISELLRLAHVIFGDGIFVTQTLVPRFSCDLIFIL